MKINFHVDPALKQDEVEVDVRAVKDTETVDRLLKYLNDFGKSERILLPIKTADRIVTVKCADIVKIEVQSTSLTYSTTSGVLKSTGRLYQVLASVNDNFIQVSRHAAINLTYLEAIEVGFAGNMVASLKHNLKADVSRHYLPELERKLGL
ncbi:LytTR family DNA-binding domain-containing protein [Lactobacillus xylocopicola]|uniref:LytTR family transcriptional regulator n=1 Tax=Lactobacillus xylocopicola TaxID=2976676 RepID=A0ABM8BI34_9LACO|nr:LytTR family DNA-binding domain-containing protein [Lactobacillus xylocopicola]BDR60955.1 LytTR family transcriptional regulator [Lactobacillus xylocopicola]